MVDEHELWIGAQEAAEILSRNSGRDISSHALARVARRYGIAKRTVNRRCFLYSRPDVERTIVSPPSGSNNPHWTDSWQRQDHFNALHRTSRATERRTRDC